MRLVIDSKEQRCYRPKGDERQKPFDSGKKKAHTLQTQRAVGPTGLIESVSPDAADSVNDVRLLRETGLLGRFIKAIHFRQGIVKPSSRQRQAKSKNRQAICMKGLPPRLRSRH